MIASGRRLLQPEALNPAASGEGRRNQRAGFMDHLAPSPRASWVGLGLHPQLCGKVAPQQGSKQQGLLGVTWNHGLGKQRPQPGLRPQRRRQGSQGDFCSLPEGTGSFLPASSISRGGRELKNWRRRQAGGREGRAFRGHHLLSSKGRGHGRT